MIQNKETIIRFIFLYFAALIALFANNSGFDFYYLSSSQRSLEHVIESSGGWRIGDFYIPRYILGSHILYLFGLGFIPFGWVVVTLHSFLGYFILKNSSNLNPGYLLGGIAIIVINFTFMSASGVGFLALYCSYVSYKSKCSWQLPFFVASAFHPTTFILSFLSLFFKERVEALKILIFTASVAVILGMAHSSIYGKDLFSLFDKYLGIFIVRAKFISILLLCIIILVIFFYFFKSERVNQFIRKIDVPLVFCSIFFIFILSLPAQYLRGGAAWYLTYKNETADYEKKDIICSAWFSRKCYENLSYEISPRIRFLKK